MNKAKQVHEPIKPIFSYIELCYCFITALIAAVYGVLMTVPLVYTILSVVISILAFVASLNRLINEKKNVYTFLNMKLINLNSIILFFTLAILGTIPTVLQFASGSFYEPHHWINNSLTLPLIIAFFIRKFNVVERETKVVSDLHQSSKYRGVLSLLTMICFQTSQLYVMFFLSANATTSLTVSPIALSLNAVYLTITLCLYLISILYMFLIALSKNSKVSSEHAIPVASLLCTFAFYIIWLSMVFTSGNIEAYYPWCVITNLAITWTVISMAFSYHKPVNKKAYRALPIFGIASVLSLVFFAYIYNYEINSNNRSQTVASTFLFLLFIIMMVFGFFLIISSIMRRNKD